MNKKVVITIVVSAVIVSIAMFAAVDMQEPVVKQTWYFIPEGCYSEIPEFTGLCHKTKECGSGSLAKSLKGHGPVDRSEAWKLEEGLVKIDYSLCKGNPVNPEP